MRIWLSLVFGVAFAFPFVTLAQTSPPAWPEINLTTCPSMSAPIDPSQRTWKHGQSEQAEYAAIQQAFQAKNYSGAAEGANTFTERYPDSDYRDQALFTETFAQSNLKNADGEVKAALKLVQSPVAEPLARMVGLAELSGELSVFVLSNDPNKERKLSDLDNWVECGSRALTAVIQAPVYRGLVDGTRKYVQSHFDRTAGYVALLRQNYSLALSKLEMARNLNPQDALTYLWLFDTKVWSPNPDLNSGVFYLARYAELSPDIPQAADFFKQTYVTVHGSEKDLQKVRAAARADTTPPVGFNVLAPPKKEHHYGAALAASAIVGVLAYEAVKHPWLVEGYGSSESPAGKIMIFGGPGHRTYLGCLSCGQFEPDSVFNDIGEHGSSIQPESIWNRLGQFGSSLSQYSACNRLATDPPVIVDQAGNAYGRLTVNKTSPEIGMGEGFYNWLASAVCR
jgi:hypothetical protein